MMVINKGSKGSKGNTCLGPTDGRCTHCLGMIATAATARAWRSIQLTSD